jgi:hypothetical protein
MEFQKIRTEQVSDVDNITAVHDLAFNNKGEG